MTKNATFLKHIIILVGPKGSGKTTLSRTLASNLGIQYFDVEKHLIETIRANKIDGDDLPNHGFDIEETEIRTILANESAVVFEATGSSEYFPHYYNMYAKEFSVLPIKLVCSYETCLERISKRGLVDNFEVPVEAIRRIYDLSVRFEVDWFQVINTENQFSPDEAIKKLRCVMST